MLAHQPEWVTPELYVQGATLRFFARLDDPTALLATVLTWLGLELRREELALELHARKHLPATEDDWYSTASETYHEFLRELTDPDKRHAYEMYALDRFFTRFDEPEILAALGFSPNPQVRSARRAADRMAFSMAA